MRRSPPAFDEGFDEVAVLELDGSSRRISRAEFEALRLDERVRRILRNQFKFYRLGVEIPMRNALRND